MWRCRALHHASSLPTLWLPEEVRTSIVRLEEVGDRGTETEDVAEEGDLLQAGGWRR